MASRCRRMKNKGKMDAEKQANPKLHQEKSRHSYTHSQSPARTDGHTDVATPGTRANACTAPRWMDSEPRQAHADCAALGLIP